MNSSDRVARPCLLCILLAGTALFGPFFPSARAQETNEERGEEIVANLAAGHVVIAVAKDAIVIASEENRVEPDTLPPAIVQVGSERAGILLGAVDWLEPEAHVALARLPRELPRLHAGGGQAPPQIMQSTAGEATDIERAGDALRLRLNQLAGHIHGKLAAESDEPIIELVLAGYVPDYGPEVWLLTYTVEQEPERGDYWRTRFTGPRYEQLWPPEKGQPRTLVEVVYPRGDAAPRVLDLLERRDDSLKTVMEANQEVVEGLLHGESTKLHADAMIRFLNGAMESLAAPQSRRAVAVIRRDQGFDWIVRPPAEEKMPGEQSERPPGAPTLEKPDEDATPEK